MIIYTSMFAVLVLFYILHSTLQQKNILKNDGNPGLPQLVQTVQKQTLW